MFYTNANKSIEFVDFNILFNFIFFFFESRIFTLYTSTIFITRFLHFKAITILFKTVTLSAIAARNFNHFFYIKFLYI